MSISNYGELKTTVANWLTRVDLTVRIPEFIALGEARLFTELRVREMQTTVAIAITTGARTTTLPERFAKIDAIYFAGGGRPELRTEEEFWSVWGFLADARPRAYFIEGDNVYWGPLPDQDYTAQMSYYKREAALAADADTNAILQRWPNLYLYPALLEAAPFLKNDPRIVTWATMYDDLLGKVHDADRLDRMSGDTVVATRAVA